MGDDTLVRAVEANFVDVWSLLGDSAGELHVGAEARWICAGDYVLLNAVLETRTDPLPTPVAIEKLATRIIDRAGSCVWWVLPSASGTPLAQRLEKIGFSARPSWPGMAVRLDELVAAPAVSALELLRVESSDAFDDYMAAFDGSLSPGPGFSAAFRRAATVIGFEVDAPMAHFVVRENGVPIACASFMEGGGAAGLYNVGTVEAARGRGIGAWVSTTALLHGQRRGYPIGVLQSSKLGYRVYQRLGFREVCGLTPYIRPVPPAKD